MQLGGKAYLVSILSTEKEKEKEGMEPLTKQSKTQTLCQSSLVCTARYVVSSQIVIHSRLHTIKASFFMSKGSAAPFSFSSLLRHKHYPLPSRPQDFWVDVLWSRHYSGQHERCPCFGKVWWVWQGSSISVTLFPAQEMSQVAWYG